MKSKAYIFTFLYTIFFLLLSSIARNESTNEKKYNNYLGDNNASNVLIEYASLSCVHCANFHNDRLPSIKKKLIDTGKLKYIYKDFPLDLPAMLASMVSHCFSNDQYFEIISSLFRNQRKWVSSSENNKKLFNSFHSILKEHGVTIEKINSCTEESEQNKNKWDSILSTRLEGQKLGVNSTPTFFLNGKKLDGLVNLKLIEKHIY